jgi:peroxiredoxin
MTISVGDRVSRVELGIMTADGPSVISSDDIFKGKKVALFGLPAPSPGPVHRGTCRASCKTPMR